MVVDTILIITDNKNKKLLLGGKWLKVRLNI